MIMPSGKLEQLILGARYTWREKDCVAAADIIIQTGIRLRPLNITLGRHKMIPTMGGMSQYAFGIDYDSKVEYPNNTKSIWSIDRFNPRKANNEHDARLSLQTGSHSTAESNEVLRKINTEKSLLTKLMGEAIDSSWVGYANGMGLAYHEAPINKSKPILTVDHLKKALNQLDLQDQLSALYFLTGYARDVIHREVMWGATHQITVEDYVMDYLNASFSIARKDMKPGHKTCVSILYAQVYNSKKNRLLKSVLPGHVDLGVESRGFKTKINWKRPKSNYFVHTRITENIDESRLETELRDVREATSYSFWKAGTLMKLYKFQDEQRRKGFKQPNKNDTSLTPWSQGVCVDGGATVGLDENKCDKQVLNTTSVLVEKMVGIPAHPKQSNVESTSKIPKHAIIIPIRQSHTLHDAVIPYPSKTGVFMMTHPGGQLETRDRAMKVVERQVSSQLQKKGPTSAQGRNALVAIAETAASKNKENGRLAPSVNKRKVRIISALKTKGNRKQGGVGQGPKINKERVSEKSKKARKELPGSTCEYGCHHGGLVELLQMIPKDTKYHLESGNYFHQKKCRDCKEWVGDLFGKSRSRAIFYYCHMDNKVADLNDDDHEKEATACACILCLPCYYKREENKKGASGKSTRTSGRVRG